MKSFSIAILTILILLLVINCTYWPTDWDYRMPYAVGVFSIEGALSWVTNEIQYKSDNPLEKEDTWQLPHETYEKRTGDCEDQVLLFMYLIYIEVGIETIKLVAIEDHALARIDDVYYDPTIGYMGPREESWEVLSELNFGEAMGYAAYY